MLQLKPGVKLLGIVPQMSIAVQVLDSLFSSLGFPCVITAGSDGSHSETSEHYAGRALDFRTRHLDNDVDIEKICVRAQEALGVDFYVLLESKGTENEHIHVHYRPKKS